MTTYIVILRLYMEIYKDVFVKKAIRRYNVIYAQ